MNIQVLGQLLSLIADPQRMLFPVKHTEKETSHMGAGSRHSTHSAQNSSSISTRSINGSAMDSLMVSLRSRSPRLLILVNRAVRRLLGPQGMESLHNKVACQCIALVQAPEILEALFVVPRSRSKRRSSSMWSDDDYGDHSGSDGDDGYGSGNDSNAYEDAEGDGDADPEESRSRGAYNAWKQGNLEALVEVLRKNRRHWHPAVKSASASLYDTLIDYL
jgi:hypothetical protein